jgi:hypothetical protein
MAWHLAVIAVLLGVFSVALYSSVAHSLYLEVDVRLLSKAEELINYAHTGQIDFERDQIAFSTEDLLIQVSRLDGTVLHKSPALRASPLGIAPEDLPHIFERFYRVDKARSSGGAGLGLALVREIVTQHHGDIRVESTLHQGTIVTISLPLVDPLPQPFKGNSPSVHAP